MRKRRGSTKLGKREEKGKRRNEEGWKKESERMEKRGKKCLGKNGRGVEEEEKDKLKPSVH